MNRLHVDLFSPTVLTTVIIIRTIINGVDDDSGGGGGDDDDDDNSGDDDMTFMYWLTECSCNMWCVQVQSVYCCVDVC